MNRNYYSYSNSSGMKYHETEQEAEAFADALLSDERDTANQDGWCEDEVESITWGEVRQQAKKTITLERENVEWQDEEEGHDTDGRYWGSHDTWCEYELLPPVGGIAQPDNTVFALGTSVLVCDVDGIIRTKDGRSVAAYVNNPGLAAMRAAEIADKTNKPYDCVLGSHYVYQLGLNYGLFPHSC